MQKINIPTWKNIEFTTLSEPPQSTCPTCKQSVNSLTATKITWWQESAEDLATTLYSSCPAGFVDRFLKAYADHDKRVTFNGRAI